MERSDRSTQRGVDPFLFEQVEQVVPSLGRGGGVSADDQCGCGYCYCHGGGCSCVMCLAMPAELPQITERVIASRVGIGEAAVRPTMYMSASVEEER